MQTPTPATTAINAQLLQALISLEPLLERIRSNDSGSDRWEQTKQITDQARAAVQAAMHQDVLEELIYAHKIIANALSLMAPGQKSQWAHCNEGFLTDMGITRANERLSVIQRAGGSL